MGSKFECFVEIYDQRYDLVVQELGLCVKFGEIWPKVQQIVRIALKEDISFFTHVFEIFDCNPDIRSVITRADHLVNSLSTITITSKKHGLNGSSSPEVLNRPLLSPPIQQSFAKEEDYLMKSSVAIKEYKSIVMSINIGWDLKDSSPDWQRIHKIMVNKMKHHFLRPKEYFQTLFYEWTQFYAENYRINGKLINKCQEIFDLLKFVHILDLEKLYHQNDPILSQIREIEKTPEFVDYYNNHLKSFRFTKQRENGKSKDKQSIASKVLLKSNIPQNQTNSEPFITSNQNSIINGEKTSIPQNPVHLKGKHPLIKEAKEIEKYHNIVKSIHKCWNKKAPKDINWRNCHLDFVERFPLISKANVEKIFSKWTTFYAQNYYMNGILVPELQKTFDLLKIVHILNFDDFPFFGKRNKTKKRIQEISNNPEMREYFGRHLQDFQSKRVSNDLRNKLSLQPSLPSTPVSGKTVSKTPERTKQMEESSKRFLSASAQERQVILSNNSLLENMEFDVRAFQRIVLAMNIGWDFSHTKKNWEKVAKTIKDLQFTAEFCRNKFFFCAKFYAKNYQKFRNHLSPYYEEMFNSMDLIHSLDLRIIFNPNDRALNEIEVISRDNRFRQQFSQNFKQIKQIKVESKEENPNTFGAVVSEQHLNAYRKLCAMFLGNKPTMTAIPTPIPTAVRPVIPKRVPNAIPKRNKWGKLLNNKNPQITEEEKERKAMKDRLYAHTEKLRNQNTGNSSKVSHNSESSSCESFDTLMREQSTRLTNKQNSSNSENKIVINRKNIGNPSKSIQIKNRQNLRIPITFETKPSDSEPSVPKKVKVSPPTEDTNRNKRLRSERFL